MTMRFHVMSDEQRRERIRVISQARVDLRDGEPLDQDYRNVLADILEGFEGMLLNWESVKELINKNLEKEDRDG